MYDDELIEIAVEADHRLRSNLADRAPAVSAAVDGWLREMFGAASLAEVFTRRDAFPMLLIPWWLDGSIGQRQRRLHQALTYSTMNGYLYIRLIDNLMDKDGPGEASLLPALSFFHLEFIEPYRVLFGADHPFWADLRAVWLETADVTMQDAMLTDIDRDTFEAVSARKTGAAKIPVTAICHHRDRFQPRARWHEFVNAFGRWHQMHNDIFSWKKDASHGALTYFLSEGRRQHEQGTIEEWFIDRGFAWGIDELARYMVELKRIANTLDPAEPLAYLQEREGSLVEQTAGVKDGLIAVSSIRSALSD